MLWRHEKWFQFWLEASFRAGWTVVASLNVSGAGLGEVDVAAGDGATAGHHRWLGHLTLVNVGDVVRLAKAEIDLLVERIFPLDLCILNSLRWLRRRLWLGLCCAKQIRPRRWLGNIARRSHVFHLDWPSDNKNQNGNFTTSNNSHSPVDVVVWLIAIKRQIPDTEKKQNFKDDGDEDENCCCDVDPIAVRRWFVKKASKLIRRNILACSIWESKMLVWDFSDCKKLLEDFQGKKLRPRN